MGNDLNMLLGKKSVVAPVAPVAAPVEVAKPVVNKLQIRMPGGAVPNVPVAKIEAKGNDPLVDAVLAAGKVATVAAPVAPKPGNSLGIKLPGNILPKPVAAPAAPVIAVAEEEIDLGTLDFSEGEPDTDADTLDEKAAALEAPEEFAHSSMPDNFNPQEMEELQGILSLLRENLDDKNIVGNAVHNLMHKLREDPKFEKMMLPEDFGLMVRGLRGAYGVTVATKSANKSKRSKSTESVDDVLNALDGMEFNI